MSSGEVEALVAAPLEDPTVDMMKSSVLDKLRCSKCNEPGILLAALGRMGSLSGWYDILSRVHSAGVSR